MGFVWEHADSFLHCVASPFQSFVTTNSCYACADHESVIERCIFRCLALDDASRMAGVVAGLLEA